MMDSKGRRNLQDDWMSECRSFGSNPVPCSQSRKMSIGIVIDSSAKSRPKNAKENNATAPVQENIKPTEGSPMVNRSNREKVDTPIPEKQVEAPRNETSPWVSTRTFYPQMPTSEAIHNAERDTLCLPATSEMREKGTSATYSVQLFTNPALDSKSNDQKEKKFNKVSSRRKEKKDVTAESSEKFSFATAKEVVQEKEVTEVKTNKADNGGTETLRSKLWEILETVSSPNKNGLNSQAVSVGEKCLHPDQKGDINGNPVLNPRQNSDTIESDSERPNHIVRRPTTRSLTRKRAPAKQQRDQIKKSAATCNKKDHLEKDIFSFKGGWSGRLSDAFNDGPLTSKRVKNMRKSCGAEGRESSANKINKVEENKQAKDDGNTRLSTEKSLSRGIEVEVSKKDSVNLNRGNTRLSIEKSLSKGNEVELSKKDSVLLNRGNTRLSTEKSSSRGNEVEVSRKDSVFLNRGNTRLSTEKSPSRVNAVEVCKKDSVLPKTGNLEKDFSHTVARKMMKTSRDNVDTSTLQEEACHHDHFNQSPMNYDTHSPNSELNAPVRSSSPASQPSPNSEINAPVRSSSPVSQPKRKLSDLDDHSPGHKIYTRRGIRGSKGFLSSKTDYLRSNAQAKPSVDAEDLKDSPYLDSRHVLEEESEDRPSESSSEEQDSESSADSLNTKGYQQTQTLSPDIVTAEKPNSMSPPHKMFSNEKSSLHKMFRNQRVVKSTELGSASASPKGVEETDKLLMHLEQHQDDGLASSVALFALALERVKGKMKSLTQKKSTEILMSVDEGIHVQLLNVESQIQEDVGKLTDLGRAKRKRMETKFQGLQEQLRAIYGSFKEEVNGHLQECRKTVEDLEAYKIELKGSMEKQRALHKKLLLQAEEAIENQLSDAERRIATVQDLARGKMIQLKNALAECLRDGILS